MCLKNIPPISLPKITALDDQLFSKSVSQTIRNNSWGWFWIHEQGSVYQRKRRFRPLQFWNPCFSHAFFSGRWLGCLFLPYTTAWNQLLQLKVLKWNWAKNKNCSSVAFMNMLLFLTFCRESIFILCFIYEHVCVCVCISSLCRQVRLINIKQSPLNITGICREE